MNIEVINREAVLNAFHALKKNGITTISIDTVIDIIEMFPVLKYIPEEVFKDGRL